ncbi:MAG: hypothetical protein MUF60_00935, partial [Vicinamibacterales bacterium]|nr:hypothetical protein [Vicinamibacterales bacterium]
VAVRGVVGHLVAQRAIGAITSHDLALAEAPEVRAHADCVHFREVLDGDAGAPAMRFDYRLRPGVATSRNALALMRAVGLGDLVQGPGGRPRSTSATRPDDDGAA